MKQGDVYVSLRTGRAREVVTLHCSLSGDPRVGKIREFMQYRTVLPSQGRVTTVLQETFNRWRRKNLATLSTGLSKR